MKNLSFYIQHICKSFVPKYFSQRKLNSLLQEAKKYPDEVMETRVNYYINNLNGELSKDAVLLKDFKRPKKGTMYFFDLVQYTRYFKNHLKIEKTFFSFEAQNRKEAYNQHLFKYFEPQIMGVLWERKKVEDWNTF